MVRMVDLVKSGRDEEPDPRKKKKSSLPEKGKDPSGSSEEERPAQMDLSESEKDTGAGKGISLGGAGSLRSPTSLGVKSKYCPYLGGRKNRDKIIDYPALTNVCYAEGSQEKKLLRIITFPFSVIPAQRQREFCLATYHRCPVYQAKQKEEPGD